MLSRIALWKARYAETCTPGLGEGVRETCLSFGEETRPAPILHLYDLPSQWVPVDERGRLTQTPTIPAAYHPGRAGDGASKPLPAAGATPRPAGKGRPRRARDPEADQYFLPGK